MHAGRGIAIVAVTLIAAAGWQYWRTQPAPADVQPQRPPEASSQAAKGETASRISPAHTAEDSPRPAIASAATSPDPPAARPAIGALQSEQWRAEIERLYEDVGQDLRLGNTETDALLSLLLDQRIRYAEEPGLDMSVAGVAARQELSAQHRREIEELIGAERTRKLDEYQRSLQVRYEVEEVRRWLERDGLSLSETQRKALIRRGIERGAYAGPIVFTGAESQVALTQEMQARNEIAYQRMAEVARSLLTAEQFARFEARWEMSRQAFEQSVPR